MASTTRNESQNENSAKEHKSTNMDTINTDFSNITGTVTAGVDLYQLTFYVPQTHTQQCLDALFAVGAGTWPNPNPDTKRETLAQSASGDDGNKEASNNATPASNTSTPTSISKESEPKYINTCFISQGTGQFQPTAAANPHIGTAGGQVEYVQEDRVEMVIAGRKREVERAVTALRRAHPYEVVAYFVVKSEVF